MWSGISVEEVGWGDGSTSSSSISVDVKPQSFLSISSAGGSAIPEIQCRSPGGGSQAFTLANNPLCKRLDFMADGINDSISCCVHNNRGSRFWPLSAQYGADISTRYL